MEKHSLRRRGWELFLISFGVLSLELCLIRWVPGQVRVVAYFPNLILIAVFLGLGLGALGARERSWIFPVALGALLLTAIGLSGYVIHSGAVTEHLWLLYDNLPPDAPQIYTLVWPVVFLFTLTALTFVPLGRAIAVRLSDYREGGRPLIGYAADLAGSLAGTVAFLGLTALRTPPAVWFALAFCGLLPLTRWKGARLSVGVGMAALVILAVMRFDRAEIYSPYYGLTVQSHGSTVRILTNGSLHQIAFDPTIRTETSAEYGLPVDGYSLPVRSLQQPPRRALVLGAGSGNDVAVLLMHGVPEVHAVEIDPEIIAIGRNLHPTHPYLDPRVVIHNTDARAFLERTNLEFDLIVFGTLDSMTKLSAQSQVRLDNFVYTVECIRAARARLTDRGGLALMFMCGNEELMMRLHAMMTTAWDSLPLFRVRNYYLFDTMLLAGPGFEHLRGHPMWTAPWHFTASTMLTVPTDDWPYLYLSTRTIPSIYIQIGAAVLGVSLLLLLFTSRQLRQDLRHGRVEWDMLIFGAAFLLLETAFVTQMSLLFGVTWIASGVVFAAVLLALLVATLISHRWQPSGSTALVVVIGALIASGSFSVLSLAPQTLWGRVGFALVYCGVPVAAAGVAFAARFREKAHVGSAFGWNVLGALGGGLLEMLSMLTGLRALFLIAGALYAGILLLCLRRSRSPALTSPTP